jgi:hypothetical protein
MASEIDRGTEAASSGERAGELVHRISDDVKAIASNELELVRGELASSVRTAAVEGAVVLLGGIVALVGLGLLCVAAVAALDTVIAPLWARLLILAVVYLGLGAVVAGVFVRRLQRDAAPDLHAPIAEARSTIHDIKAGLEH